MSRLADTLILFDWNGTIVLDADRSRLALNGVLSKRGLPALTPSEFGSRFRLPMGELFEDLGVDATELVESEAEWNLAMSGADPRGRPGTVAALLALHAEGCSLGVVSAAARATIAVDMASLRLPAVFDVLRAGVADKAAVLDEERGTRPRALYVGDTVYDIGSARAAGFRAIGVTGGYTAPQHLIDAGAEAIVHDLRELEVLLARTP